MYHPLPGHQPHSILLLPSEHEGRASSPSKKPSVLSCRANHHQCGYVFCLCLIILDLQFNKGTDDWHGLWIDAEKNLKETYGLYQQLREYQGVLYIYVYSIIFPWSRAVVPVSLSTGRFEKRLWVVVVSLGCKSIQITISRNQASRGCGWDRME